MNRTEISQNYKVLRKYQKLDIDLSLRLMSPGQGDTTVTYLQAFDHLIVADFVCNLFYSWRIDDLPVPRRFLLLRELHTCGCLSHTVFYWPLWVGKQKFSTTMLPHLPKTSLKRRCRLQITISTSRIDDTLPV